VGIAQNLHDGAGARTEASGRGEISEKILSGYIDADKVRYRLPFVW
jgi:hypothetical protein